MDKYGACMKIKNDKLTLDLVGLGSKSNPITVEALKSLLSSVEPSKPFVLTGQSLGVSAIQELFDNYLPDKILTVNTPSADLNALSITGQLDFPPNYKNLNVKIQFTHDETYITGIVIRAALPGWEIKTTFLEQSLSFLKVFGCSTLYLLLATEEDLDGKLSPRFGFGADFTFKGSPPSTLEFNALLSDDPKADYILEGSFDSVSFADLNELSQFATGGKFDIIPSGIIPFAKLLQLKKVRLAIDPEQEKLLFTSIDVQLASDWALIPNIFEIKEIIGSFTILPSSSPSIFASLQASFNIGSLLLDASVTVPGLVLEVRTLEHIQLLQVLKNFNLSNLPIPNLTIDFLGVYIELKNKNYSVRLVTTENWNIIENFALSQLTFVLFDQGSGINSSIEATVLIVLRAVGSYQEKHLAARFLNSEMW